MLTSIFLEPIGGEIHGLLFKLPLKVISRSEEDKFTVKRKLLHNGVNGIFFPQSFAFCWETLLQFNNIILAIHRVKITTLNKLVFCRPELTRFRFFRVFPLLVHIDLCWNIKIKTVSALNDIFCIFSLRPRYSVCITSLKIMWNIHSVFKALNFAGKIFWQPN